MKAQDKEAIDCLFRPKSIAIAGVSTDPTNWGNVWVRSLRQFGFPGKIYPVNPRLEEVFGLT